MSHHASAPSGAMRHTRRGFLSAAGAAVTAFTIVPRHVLGGAGFLPPSERINVAGIGAGGMGGGDIATVAKLGANIVALCDVDESRAAASFAQYAAAARLAHDLGLGVNAGHDLDLDNLTLFRQLPHLDEVSIGHALISRALFVGLRTVVREYLDILEGGAGSPVRASTG